MIIPANLKKKVAFLKTIGYILSSCIIIFLVLICVSSYNFYKLYTTDIKVKALIHQQRAAELVFFHTNDNFVGDSLQKNPQYPGLEKLLEIQTNVENLKKSNKIVCFDTLINLMKNQNERCISLVKNLNNAPSKVVANAQIANYKNKDIIFRELLILTLVQLDAISVTEISNLLWWLIAFTALTTASVATLYIYVLQPAYTIIQKSSISIENKNKELIHTNLKSEKIIYDVHKINDELAQRNAELYIKETEILFINEELKNALEESKISKIELQNTALLLENQREDLYDLYNNAPTGYFTLDKFGKIITVNKTALSWIGYTQEEVEDNNLFENYLSPKAKKPYNAALEKAISTGKFFGILLYAMHKGGYEIAFSMNAYTLYNENKEVTKIRCTSTDMRERIKQELELTKAFTQTEIANNAKTQFLSIMSHELRTPIHGIVGNSSLLKNTNITEIQQTYIQNIEKNSDFLAAIIQHILDFVQLDSHKIDLHLQHFDIENCIDKAIEKANNKVINNRVSIETKYEQILAKTLISDAPRLEQVLVELLTNSLKFTPSGSILIKINQTKISATKFKTFIDVIDTGIGIAENDIETIFIPFKQISENLDRQSQGTGLGLAITQKIVHLLGGQIHVYQSQIGKGTHIKFDFEASIKDKIIDSEKNKVTKQIIYKTSKETNILAVDDSDMNLMLVKNMLQNLGFEAELAKDGQIALNMAIKKPYDIILMDIQMPNMDGITATKEILKYYKNKEPKPIILAITANYVIGDLENYLAAGMDNCLPKPVKQEQLKAMLMPYFGLPNAGFKNENAATNTIEQLLDQTIIDQIKETAQALNNDLDKIIFAMAKTDIPIFIKEAENYFIAGKTEDLEKMLHKIKGAAWSSGLKKIGDTCAKYEIELKSGNEKLNFETLHEISKTSLEALDKV